MFTAGQTDMQQMDRYTMDKLGLPGVVLMENAGARIVEEILTCSPGKKAKVVILAGGGNNGGDGFVIARRLVDLGWEPYLWLLVEPEKLKGDAKCQFDVYLNRGLPLFNLGDLEDLPKHLIEAEIIVDAILGTGVKGVKGAVREPFKSVIRMVNELQHQPTVISVDIPSGVNSDDGKVIEETAIKATKTVTFVFPKKGFFLQDGPKFIGEWKAVDISVPPSIVDNLHLQLPQIITESLVKKSIPKRPPYGHKGTFGHALVIGGSGSYVGAPIFTAKAALNSGAGLVTLCVPENIYPMAATQLPEALFLPLSETNGHFSKDAVAEFAPRIQQFDSIALGPGMGRFADGEQWVRELIGTLTDQPLVVDADALYLLRNDLEMIRGYEGPVIFTPHPGEMASLINKTVKEVEENRLETARKFAQDYHVLLLLKGHRSIIATPEGDIFINPHGNDALGKGGSGDVLTGLIASFLAQGALPVQAVLAASFLHARSGENCAEVLSNYGVMPVDIIDGVKNLLNLLMCSSKQEQK
ncbi:NAD(P)H-hydrate epimerase [Mesobacillus persicus]|uniref:Bifunctional NAD(P)H-hydrate repair enzyme n=1 Tax=Mesobacillus persicus TaxID=930146 RepID=A0A1H8CF65_9BACI|nr:NAD(P)H-hydrate dehydratase [Mesobacillus persicus]SEM93640.1 NAD(P)H-hydrate epimerase [Mesobacillus persicus]